MRSYLDHAATSPLLPVAREAMLAELDRIGNPSSLHASGRAARRVVEEAREQLAAAVGAHPSEVIWTSGGTEADNLFLLGAATARPERARVICSAVEHPAVLEAHAALAGRGHDAALVGVSADGVIDPAELGTLLEAPTAAVSVMWVNNETGVIQPITEVSRQSRAAGAWAHTDAVQALGHLRIDFAASGLDAMSLSAHKVGGPVGVGALLLRRDIALRPIGHGGGQERALRSGTLATSLLAGFAAAVSWAVEHQDAESVRIGRLARRIEQVVAPLAGTVIHGAAVERSPAIVNVGFAGLRADDLLLLLDEAGLDTSTGSACTAGVSQPSHVLQAMGRTRGQAAAALRFSLGASSSDADVDRLALVLPEAVTRARAAAGSGR